MTSLDERFDLVSDLSSEWVWEMNADLRFVYFSPSFEHLTGMSISDVIGKTRFEMSTDNEDESSQRHIDDLIARRDFRNYTYHVETLDGRRLHIRTSGKAVYDENGTFQGYRGVAADATDKVIAERRAAMAEVSLLEAIQKAPTALALYDRNDCLVAYNDHYKFDILGKAAHVIKAGITFRDLARKVAESGIIDGIDEDLEDWLDRRVERHRNPQGPVNFHLSDGRWVQGVEFILDSGSVLSTFTDITDLKQREAELQAAKDAAELADRIKSEFLANVSHELRTPLNAILGFSQIMQDQLFGPIGDDRYINYSRDIHDSGTHLLAVINDILDLSKIESGKAELYEEVFRPEIEVEACMRLMQERAMDAGVQLTCDIADELQSVHADRRKFKQILINLLSNSVKFTLSGGHVQVTAGLDQRGGLELIVRDDGTGMDPDDIPVALTPFRQIDGSLSRSHEGTGLGLPLVNSLCQLHGGSLSLASRKGVGTTATVRFPAERTVTEREQQVAGAEQR